MVINHMLRIMIKSGVAKDLVDLAVFVTVRFRHP